jgi:prepilin-type N-terminal cleavage/methylation domain-containing protein
MKRRPAFTLMELMVVIAIMGSVTLAAPAAFRKVYQFTQLSLARIEIQKNARGSLSNMNKDLRQALSYTVVVDQVTGQPPHSRITFSKYNSVGATETISYYQKGRYLYMQSGGAGEKLLVGNLRYLTFSYPNSTDPSIIAISVTFEKATYEGASKALQMAVEKVRIMN